MKITRVTLFVPGSEDLKRAGVEGEWIENDGSFSEAFSFGTVPPEGVEAIEAAPGAWLVQLQDDLREGRDRVVKVVEKLRKKSAVAIRFEQSKLGWLVDEWLERAGSGNAWELHKTAVTMLIGDGHVASCGMHLFSLPDARVEHDDPDQAQELLTVLNVYQIDEDPLLLSGNTFSPDAETPRRVVQRWPDDRYRPAHWCHNPYGVWHLSAPGAKSRPQPELHLQFIPALVTLLTALEEERGPLTRTQVEDIRDKARCMTVAHRDAQKLERSRGYADLDPELAWEQWCVVRDNRD